MIYTYIHIYIYIYIILVYLVCIYTRLMIEAASRMTCDQSRLQSIVIYLVDHVQLRSTTVTMVDNQDQPWLSLVAPFQNVVLDSPWTEARCKLETAICAYGHGHDHGRDHGHDHDHMHLCVCRGSVRCRCICICICMCKHDISAFNVWGPIWEPKQTRKCHIYTYYIHYIYIWQFLFCFN